MKYFEHESAATFDEAVSLLKESPKGKTVVMAGGSDLIGVLKEQILEDYPEKVVDLKTVRGGEYIKQDGDTIEIGALTKLCDIVKSDLLNEKAPVLSQAARSVATPLIRNVATMGGNICPGCALLVLPLSPRHRRQDGLYEKGRKRVLCRYGRQPLPFHIRGHEGTYHTVFCPVSGQYGHTGLYGAASGR